jgi:hypothetical protein
VRAVPQRDILYRSCTEAISGLARGATSYTDPIVILYCGHMPCMSSVQPAACVLENPNSRWTSPKGRWTNLRGHLTRSKACVTKLRRPVTYPNRYLTNPSGFVTNLRSHLGQIRSFVCKLRRCLTRPIGLLTNPNHVPGGICCVWRRAAGFPGMRFYFFGKKPGNSRLV